MPRFAALAFATALLSACGMKGALMLPPGPPPEPLLGNPKPAPAADKTERDVSTDRTAAPQ